MPPHPYPLHPICPVGEPFMCCRGALGLLGHWITTLTSDYRQSLYILVIMIHRYSHVFNYSLLTIITINRNYEH